MYMLSNSNKVVQWLRSTPKDPFLRARWLFFLTVWPWASQGMQLREVGW